MVAIERVVLNVSDPEAAERLATALGVGDRVGARASEEPTTGFRGFTVSLVVAQPSDVDALVDAAIGAGATVAKPATKSLWGYGGTLQDADGTVWTVASSSKKDKGPTTRKVEELIVQLGVEDVGASKQFYVDHGVPVAKSYGRKYVELDTSPVKVSLLKRTLAAKNAGVSPDGTGSPGLELRSDVGAFTDLDGYVWDGPSGVSA
jgi:predicted lactoylglutathione lyase